MSSLDEMFGTLRALIDGGFKYESQRIYFLHFLSQAYDRDRARYQAQWVPYLCSLRVPWPEPFISVSTIAKLKRYVALLPCVRFELSFGLQALDEDEFALLDSALSSSLSALSFWDCELKDVDHNRLSSCSFEQIKRLELSAIKITNEQASLYLNRASYPALEHLDLHAGEIDDSFLSMFTGSEYAGQIHRLGLGATQVTGQGLCALMTSPKVPRISWINMASTNITCAELGVMVESGRLQDAEYVQLSNCKVGDDGAAALSSSPKLTRLGHLDLVGTGLTNQGLSALLNSELGAGLRSFNVSSNPHVALASALASAPELPALNTLSHHGELEPGALPMLAQSRALSQLKSLALWNSGLELEQLRQLVEAPWFGQLESLGLSYQRFGDEGWRWLFTQPQLSSIKVLKLWGVALSEGFVKALVESPYLSNLEQLDGVAGKEISTKSRKMWAKARHLKEHLKHMPLMPEMDELYD